MGELVQYPLWGGSPSGCSPASMRVALKHVRRLRGEVLSDALAMAESAEVQTYLGAVAAVAGFDDVSRNMARWLFAAQTSEDDMRKLLAELDENAAAATLTPPFVGAVLCARLPLTLGGVRFHRGCAVPLDAVMAARNSAHLLKSCLEWREPAKVSMAAPVALPPPVPATPLPKFVVVPDVDLVVSWRKSVARLRDLGCSDALIEDLAHADDAASNLMRRAVAAAAYRAGWPNHRRIPPRPCEV